MYEGALQDLIDELGQLPGVGPKSAQRMALHLLEAEPEDVERLTTAINAVRHQVKHCVVCGNLTEDDECSICRDPRRDPSVICVVQEPKDIQAIENSRVFRGRYHVLGGAIDPIHGIGPDQLSIRQLLGRLSDGVVQEIIIATNPNIEGEATASYLARTQTAVFASVGAFAPVDDLYNKVGGDKLIQSFIDAGRWDNKLYALPLYAGARGIIYRKDLFEKANIAVPKSIDELADAAIKLGKANPDKVEGFSGMYLSAVDIHGVESLMFAGGGDYATLSNGKWQEKLTDPATIASLERIQKIFKDGTAYAMDSSASQKSFQKYFNENKVGILVGTGSVAKKIDKELWDAGKVGVMPIPGVKEGSVGQTFAGGSSISLASNAQNPELAKKALEVIFSEKFQTMVAKAGWTPGNTQYGSASEGAFADISTTVIENSKLTPNTPQWGVVAGDNVIRDFFTEIAQGKGVKTVAKDAGAKLDTTLNKQ